MKKLIATLVSLVVLSMAALPVAAQTRSRCANGSTYSGSNTRYDARSARDGRYRGAANQNADYRTDVYNNGVYNDGVYNNDSYSYGDNRSVWEQHRDKITTAGGAVAGALLGGLIGGKKGAVIGAVTGGAGAAVYTYKIRNKNGRY